MFDIMCCCIISGICTSCLESLPAIDIELIEIDLSAEKRLVSNGAVVREAIEVVLHQTGWNRKQAAGLLGVSYKTLLQNVPVQMRTERLVDALAYLRTLRNDRDVAAFERIVNVPTVATRHLAHDSVGLVQIGNTEVWRSVELQSPGGEKVIFGPRAPNGRFLLAVNVDLLVTLAKP